MLTILAITAPIFLLIGLGYGTVRFGVFAQADMRILGKFVMNVALPAVLYRALADRPLAELVSSRYLAAYALGSLIALGLALLWFRGRGFAGGRVGVLTLGMSASNTAFIGLPVVTQFLGPGATAAVAMTMLVENFVIVPLALGLADSAAGQGKGWRLVLRDTFAGLARTPLILAIVAGAIASLVGLTLPAPLHRAIDLLAGASTPTALFVIGGALVGLRVHGMVLDVAAVTVGKLVLHPVAVCVALMLFTPADPMLVTAAIVLAASPMLSIYPIFGQRYGVEQLAAAAVVATTVASFVTISLLLWMLRPA